MDASKLNLVVATAALQGIGYNSDRLRQLFESSLVQSKETKDVEPDRGFFEGPGRLSIDGSKVAKYNPTLNLFKCIYCGVTGSNQRLAEHYLASHVDTSSQIYQCPNCLYTSAWARCVRMHLNKQHGLAEIPSDLWASAHPLLVETTKLLNDLKTYVGLQFVAKGSVGIGNVGVIHTLSNQLPLIPLPNKTQTAKTKANNSSGGNGAMVKKRYTCERCAYSTDRRDLYNRHENIHKEDKPFHCYVCHKLFNRADHVKKHFLRIHKGRPYNVALIRRHSANIGGIIGGSVLPATALSSACTEPASTLDAPFALALAQQAAQIMQNQTQSAGLPQQLQLTPVNASLTLSAGMSPSEETKAVVPIGPITPANGTVNPAREMSPPPLLPPTSPVLRSSVAVKRKADSSTSTSKVLVETTEPPVVCPVANTSSDRVMKRHVRSYVKAIQQKSSCPTAKIKESASQTRNNRESQSRLKKREPDGPPHSSLATRVAEQPQKSEENRYAGVPVGSRSRSYSPTTNNMVPTPSPSASSPKKRDSVVLDPSQVKEYACELCSWRGVDGWGLRRHFNTHLKPFRCQFCDYRAARPERLGAHVLRVHGKHLCAKCDLSFIDATALDNHVRTEHRSTNQYTRPRPASSTGSNTGSGGASGSGESPTHLDDDSTETATDFDKRAEKQESLMMVGDQDVDEGETIFHCRWCILSFADKLSLKYHLETKHSGAPVGNINDDSNDFTPAFPYQCTICGFKCFTQGTIMDHMRIHSGQLARCQANDGGPRGTPCGFSTPFDSELTRHVANLHGQRGGHCAQCLHCGLVVNKADELMKHVSDRHHNKLLECNVCRKAFLEYFPQFYGRVCPSTAPVSDQYTHMPQFLASNPSGFLEKLLTDVYRNLTEQRSLDAKTASIILSTIHKLKNTKVTETSTRTKKSRMLEKLKSINMDRPIFRCSRCSRKILMSTYGAKKIHVLMKHSRTKKRPSDRSKTTWLKE